LWFAVPVHLLTSSTTATTPPAPTGSTTAIGYPDSYGCTIDNAFYADGAQVRQIGHLTHTYKYLSPENHLPSMEMTE
jgi:hypothetical protein